MARAWTTYDWIKLIGAIVLLVLLLLYMGRQGPVAAAAPTLSAPSPVTLQGPTVDLSGTGAPGGFIQLLLNGNKVGTPVRVGNDGRWALPGFNFGAPGDYTLTLQPVDARGASLGPGTDLAFRVPQPSSRLQISEPVGGASVPAGTFQLRGVGTPGEVLEVFEDNTSLGRVTVNPDGTWTLAVPPPSAGAHTYEARGAGATARIQVSVAAANPTTAACTKAFTLSLRDGETVARPFRFGGEGAGPGYTVTVKRGERIVGSQEVSLDAACGWSYRSDPGPGAFTYEVRPIGAPPGNPPLKVINLTVR
ncbi:MAG: hypothetical protein N2Z75_02145 [Meiothermus sp.]|uniref:Ig-like domain-containing protein n=1 Tax=Meiothermus sp. TaxID=1955249 RepID=UPI0025E9FC37|nr:Ig-like domain-containing protein [Meiothermus sp.]MCS7069245.1 hypothetical protein [Meiothermus sp.]MCX7600722.1 hypothetical protein [Meiothermus sp.]MDW8425395.1 Ig-like domain-containing protein [Meiothermus sp.]